MTPNEALHEISTKVFRNTDDFEMRISKDCYKEIVKCLEKQIPKEPIVDPANLCDFQNFHCPKCNQKIIARLDGEWIAGKLQNYCDKCGQALDWSDTK